MKLWCSVPRIATITAYRSSLDLHSIGSSLNTVLDSILDEVFESSRISLDFHHRHPLGQEQDLMLPKPHQLEAINYFNLSKLRFLCPVLPPHVCSYYFEQLS